MKRIAKNILLGKEFQENNKLKKIHWQLWANKTSALPNFSLDAQRARTPTV
jgi:hypothetical protein